jgi:hypothetical protein
LWADALQSYCRLFEAGHMLATNLHADDLEQARDQVCGDNGVPIEHFNRFDLLIFLRVDDGYFEAHRWIEQVYAADGSSEHALVYNASDNKGVIEHAVNYSGDPAYLLACRDFLEAMKPNVRTIEDTRLHVVQFLRRNPSA